MRLVDADAMREDWLENGENEYVYDTNAILDSIDEQPTIDAVPVVRCKDCKRRHWYQEPCHGKSVHVCRELDAEVTTDFFCAAGERRADNE